MAEELRQEIALRFETQCGQAIAQDAPSLLSAENARGSISSGNHRRSSQQGA
jgi:hypothetical protein